MRRWLPTPTIGRWIGVLLLLLALAGSGLVGSRVAALLAGPPETWAINLSLYAQLVLLLLLIVVAGALIYRVAASFTLHYTLDRNGLYVNWLGNRAVIPLDQVQSIDIGVAAAGLWNAMPAIGYHAGQRQTPDGKTLHLFSTRAPSRSLAVHTPEAVYAISPADTEAFVQDLEQRRNLGATKPLTSTVEPSRMFLYAFWNDRTVRALLLTALALNLMVLALLAARYPFLAPVVEMRFNAAGEVAAMQPRHQLIFLPLAAFGLSLLNTGLGLLFYQTQQVGARLLQGASVVVQILFGIAVITIIR